MRAIAALVCSFLLIAAIQAGYMIVEARRAHKGALSTAPAVEEESHVVPQKLSLERRRRKHDHSVQDVSVPLNSSDPVKPSALKDDSPKLDKHATEEYTKRGQRKKTNRTSKNEKEHKHKKKNRDTDEEQRERIKKARKHRKPKSPHHGKPINVYVPGTEKNDSVKQLLQVAIEPPLVATDDAKPEKSEDPFLTAKPESPGLHKSKPKSPTKALADKQPLAMKEEIKARMRKYMQARYSHRRARKNHRKSRRMCESQADCGHGECCIERKAGQKYCLPGGIKPVGKHCMDACLCKPGLQCYVQAAKHKKPLPEGKPPYGKCVDSSKVDVTKGYLLPPTSTTTPLPVTKEP